METISRPGLPVYDYQPGEGPALVLLHYWGGSARTWQQVIDLLPGTRHREHRCPRLATLARSARTIYTLEQLAQDVRMTCITNAPRRGLHPGRALRGRQGGPARGRRTAGRLAPGLVLVASVPSKPAAHITPEFQEQLLHAYDSDEAVAAGRDHILTATPLSDDIKAQIVADYPERRPRGAR